MGVQQQSSDNITDCMESPQRQQLQQIKRSPLSGKKVDVMYYVAVVHTYYYNR